VDYAKHTRYIDRMLCSSESSFFYFNDGGCAEEEALQFGISFIACTAVFIPGCHRR